MNHILDGKAIDVKKAVPKCESYSDVVNRDQSFVTNKIFVGGIPLHAGEEDIKEVFSRYGQLLDQTIIRDKVTNLSRGFGFVEFEV
jgi:RNA recognition motif-containing protein